MNNRGEKGKKMYILDERKKELRKEGSTQIQEERKKHRRKDLMWRESGNRRKDG